jgi:hypothetical protein
MNRSELEQRKRVLEEQLQTAIALLQSGHAARLRELEDEWLASTEEDAPEGPRRRASPGRLYQEVAAVLSTLPEVFDRRDVVRALGYKPDRVSLFRVLRSLEEEGDIALESSGRGRRGSTYRLERSIGAVEHSEEAPE